MLVWGYSLQLQAQITFQKTYPAGGFYTDKTTGTAASPCNGSNTFWGINFATGEVSEFDLTAGVITYTGNIISNCPGGSLAICDNLNGGATTPTFYTNYLDSVYHWDGGGSWLFAGVCSQSVQNAGGNSSNLYFHYTPGTFAQLIKYNGVNFSLFFTLNKISGLADVAVDAAGNIWMVTSSSPVSSTTDSIYVISPSAQILQQYSFVINCNNAYGCFLMNGILYIGLGSSNPVNPNTLIPVSFSGSNAIAGAPIPMPAPIVIFADLAACNPGYPLGINSNSDVQELTLSPNPARENLLITISAVPNTTYTIFNMEGKIAVRSTSIINGRAAVNVSNLKNGIYIVEIKNSKGVIRKKFARM